MRTAEQAVGPWAGMAKRLRQRVGREICGEESETKGEW